MPISSYYGGEGRKVMKDMTKRYGKKKGKAVFYAVKNKQKDKGVRAVSAINYK